LARFLSGTLCRLIKNRAKGVLRDKCSGLGLKVNVYEGKRFRKIALAIFTIGVLSIGEGV
jgi:hypothetical protein